jgi:hypothetical protein
MSDKIEQAAEERYSTWLIFNEDDKKTIFIDGYIQGVYSLQSTITTLQANNELLRELVKAAFEAGEAYANECHCGLCDYCKEFKGKPAPYRNKWLRENLPEPPTKALTPKE